MVGPFSNEEKEIEPRRTSYEEQLVMAILKFPIVPASEMHGEPNMLTFGPKVLISHKESLGLCLTMLI